MEVDQENVNCNSDDENEMNLLNKITKPRSRHKIMDSDSEPEDNKIQDEKLDDEEMRPGKSKLKRIAVVDSDSDEQTKTDSVDPEAGTLLVQELIFTTTSDGQLIPETSSYKKSGLSALCDPDTSDEEEQLNFNDKLDLDEPILKPKVYKRQRKTKNKDAPKMMTAKEAAKQREEITSESQRMLRSSNVSLPYHKPKTYSIKEFLQKRSKLASAAPSIPQAPPSVAIKMTKDQLAEVSRKLDERIKEVEEFYKSDSDDDDDVEGKELKKAINSWLELLVDSAVDDVELRSASNSGGVDDECDALEPPSKPKMTDLINDRLLNIQPKLSGTADDIIDLEEGVTKPNAVRKLVEKFLQNASKKIPHKHKVELDVVEVSGAGDIVKETVSMIVDEEEEPAMVETPGAKLQKLREELQEQMAQKRLELWKQKQEQGDCYVAERKPEEVDVKDILDDEDEEEFEMTDSDSDEFNEDEEEYVTRKEKRRVKSAFVDDEADEDEMDDDDNENDETHDSAPEKDGFEADIEEGPENDETQSPKRKVLRRIAKPFTEDSDDDDDDEGLKDAAKHLKYYNNAEDDVLPPNLPKTSRTPLKTQTDKHKSEFDFLTPVTYLTGLNNLTSSSKYSSKPSVSPISAPRAATQSPTNNSQSTIQKNLFPRSDDLDEQSQQTSESLDQTLSDGKFPETRDEIPEPNLVEESSPTTQDLLDMCSGDFNTIPDSANGNVTQKIIIHATPTKEIKNLDEDQDQIISQLLDEDELERFKKKFESPTMNAEECAEANATGLINSDDENELEVTKKRGQKKLVFSDEEDEEASEESDEADVDEDIDLHDVDVEDEEQILEEKIKAQESSNFKLADFLDKEAELSESEWGSADEDEKGLDVLDVEEADLERFNEKKIRSELERIHMRQILDDDNREVKLLQELLLEDGEMHGTGRKRQFRWKTLNGEDNGEFEKRGDDDIFLDEEESEEQWRKMRHKREMFLKKKSASGADVEDNILSDSKILTLGQRIFTSKSQTNTPAPKSDESEQPFGLLSKRGSFLSRSDQVLQRLAEYTKVSTSVASTTKNSKCFVFQTVETSETIVVKDNNKRKATEGTPNIVKRLRLDDLSPAVGKKLTEKSQRAKKLFGKS